MVLKGIMTIELTDEATGDVETVTEENMITEAVNNMPWPEPDGDLLCRHRGIRCGSFVEWEPSAHLSQHDRRHPAVLQGPGRRYGTYL